VAFSASIHALACMIMRSPCEGDALATSML
jgi:hypothetical protein